MTEQNKGYLIVVEGLDGVGKTTAISNATARLKSMGVDVVRTAESAMEIEGLDNSFSATLINLIRMKSTQEQADPTAQALMVNAARRAHYQNVIKPLLEAGKVIIMDRFYLSTFYNYQAKAEKNKEIYSIAMGDFEPDYTVVIKGDVDTSRDRIHKRGGVVDVTDESAMARFDEIQNILLSQVSDKSKGCVIDGTDLPGVVTADLTAEVLYFIKTQHQSRLRGKNS